MSSCRSCGAVVIFVKSELGRTMCLNAAPDLERGNVILETTREDVTVARVLNRQQAERARTLGVLVTYLSHHATCPDAARWSKPRATSAPGSGQ